MLLQIFSETVLGPVFFEFIQRKGDEASARATSRRCSKSIEHDQIRRGVLKGEAADGLPHDAPPPAISDENPMGTDGFEFVGVLSS